jgi:hypothetical protein
MICGIHRKYCFLKKELEMGRVRIISDKADMISFGL